MKAISKIIGQPAEAVSKIIGTTAERAQARIERTRAELQKIEAELFDLRDKRDRLLVEDAVPAVVRAVRNDIAELERGRAEALEALGAAQLARDKALADAAARELKARRQKTRELCEAYAKDAERLQRAVNDLGVAWQGMEKIANEIGAVALPVRGLRGELRAASVLREPWREAMASNVLHHLYIGTDGALGAAKGVHNLAEMRRLGLPSCADKAREMHRQVLSGDPEAAPSPKLPEAA